MEKRMEGKVAIITDGTCEIGQSIAILLAKHSAKLVLSGINIENGLKIVSEIGPQAVFVPADITKEIDCQRVIQTAMDKYGKVDLLINNLAIHPEANIINTTEKLWDQVMSVNLRGAFFYCKHVLPIMQKQKGGSIINIGSQYARGGKPDYFAYSVSNGALLTMTRTIARVYAQDGIRANWISLEYDIKKRTREQVQSIVNAILYLTSDKSSQVTGTEVPFIEL